MHGRFGLPGCWQQTWCDASPSNEPKTALFYQAFHGIPTAQVAVSAWQTRQRGEGLRTKKDAVGCCCATSARSRFEMLGMKVLWDLWRKAATDKIIPARDPKQREFNVSVDTELSITHITCWNKMYSFTFLLSNPIACRVVHFGPGIARWQSLRNFNRSLQLRHQPSTRLVWTCAPTNSLATFHSDNQMQGTICKCNEIHPAWRP